MMTARKENDGRETLLFPFSFLFELFFFLRCIMIAMRIGLGALTLALILFITLEAKMIHLNNHYCFYPLSSERNASYCNAQLLIEFWT